MARKNPKPDGPKTRAVHCRLAKRKHAGRTTLPYEIMDRLIAEKRPDLDEAGVNIAIAWRDDWKADADGNVRYGSPTVCSALHRALHRYDAVVSLNKELWDDTLTMQQRVAAVFHELCHFEVKRGDDGEPLTYDDDRPVLRMRKHDVQCFKEDMAAFGPVFASIDEAVKAANETKDRPLLAMAEKIELERIRQADEQDAVQQAVQQETQETFDEPEHAGEPVAV
jgi:hypothetical protein